MVGIVRIQSRICVGGPALHSIVLSEHLSSRRGSRFDTTLVGGALEPGEASMVETARSRGIDVEVVPEMGRPIRPRTDAVALAKLVAILRDKKPQIVHTHTAKAGALGRVAARMAGVPVVVHTFHGHVFDGYFGGPQAEMIVRTERALARASTCVVAISERQKEELSEKYRIAPAEKIRVIPLGLELERFRAIDPAAQGSFKHSLGISRETPLVVSVGRLVAIKRFDVLIEAFHRVLAALPEAHLAIAGNGEAAFRKTLEAQASDIANRVHFLGWRKDLEDIYREADVLALTSDNEGTPVAVIEALSAGVRVVATDVGGIGDVVEPGMGVLVRRGSPSDVAHALIAVLSQKDRVADVQRDAVLRRFSHHRLISDISELYDSLLRERARRVGWRVASAFL